MTKNSNNDGKITSDTPSIDLLNRMIGPSPKPRMLTAYEDELLRRSAHEIRNVVTKVLRRKDDT